MEVVVCRWYRLVYVVVVVVGSPREFYDRWPGLPARELEAVVDWMTDPVAVVASDPAYTALPSFQAV